ncbi:putative autotransporter domain protein [Escherichia coli P0301867.8]|nr:putative autotransporter domain protein [Escherichia coli P0301867.8]
MFWSPGSLDVLEAIQPKTRVDDGGTLAVSAGGKATDVTMTSGGALMQTVVPLLRGPMPAVSSVLMVYPVRPAACYWKMAAALRLMPGDRLATPLSDIVEH